MPARTLPNLGLQAFFDLGEDGWDDEMNLNLLKASVLTQGGVASKVDATPGAPVAGDVHIFSGAHPTNANDIAVYDDSAWVYFTPSEGWLLYNRAENYFELFDGSNWAELATGGGGGGGGGVGAPSTFGIFEDVKAATVGGGNATVAAWTPRTLNNVRSSDIAGASLATDQITLPAGKYRILGWQNFYRTNYTQLRLQDVTNTVTLALGTTCYVFNDADGHGMTVPLQGTFELSAEADVEFQYFASANFNVNSLGVADPTNGTIFASLLIERLDDTGLGATITEAGTAVNLLNVNASKYQRWTSTGAKTLTVQPDATESISQDAEFYIANRAASDDLTLAEGAGVTINPPSGGTLVLGPGMTATLKRVAVDEYDLVGQTVAA